jgi:DNA repair exonuclease SbcCD ATPase subunit
MVILKDLNSTIDEKNQVEEKLELAHEANRKIEQAMEKIKEDKNRYEEDKKRIEEGYMQIVFHLADTIHNHKIKVATTS